MKPQKINRCVAVDVIKKYKLNDGELALLALMKKKLKTRTVVTHEDIIDIWENHVRCTKKKYTLVDYDNTLDEYKWGYVDYQDYEILNKAKQWFYSALGRLICKQKLVVIPVIDID